jgi:hypothetical protein
VRFWFNDALALRVEARNVILNPEHSDLLLERRFSNFAMSAGVTLALGATPRDTDGDTIIDALDFDSDNDGLTDREEHDRWRTDPRSPDTDGDGFSDLFEVAYGSDPLDPSSFPDPDDSFVIVPYMEPPQVRQVGFGTDIQQADVYFLLDSTGSMETAIQNVIDSLTGTILSGLRTAFSDVQLGVGAFDDFPVDPYGDSGPTGGADQPYWHDQDITAEDWAVRSALRNVVARPRGYGGDGEESSVVALYLAATGEGLTMGGAGIPPKTCPPRADEPRARRGYPCFRWGVLPIIVLVGDAPFLVLPDAPPGLDGLEYVHGTRSILLLII